MRFIVLAQNIPALLRIGVPPDNAQAILDYLLSIEDKATRGLTINFIKNNPLISLDELKNFKVEKENKPLSLEEEMERKQQELAKSTAEKLRNFNVPEKNIKALVQFIVEKNKDDRNKILMVIKHHPELPLKELKKIDIIATIEEIDVDPEIVNELSKKLELRPQTVEWALRNRFDPKLIEWAKNISSNYVEWILKQVKNESMNPNGEDDEEIKGMIKNFDELKKQRDFPKKNKDINYYKTYGDLVRTISLLTTEKSNDEEPVIKDNDPYLIYNQNGIKVTKYEGTTSNVKAELKRVSEHTGGVSWCVGRPDSDFPQRYLSDGPLYLFLINNRRVALIHPATHQIKARANVALNEYDIIKQIFPVMEQFNIMPSRPSGDEEIFMNIITLGREINEKMDVADGQKREKNLARLQEEKQMHDGGWNSTPTGNHVLFYLSDSFFEDDENIQQYAVRVYKEWMENLDRNFIPDFCNFYKRTPHGMRTIPEITQMNKEHVIGLIKNVSKNESNVDINAVENLYATIGRELKVEMEIQDTIKNIWKKIIHDNPEFNVEKIPERLINSLKKEFYHAWIKKIEEGPKPPTKEEPSKINYYYWEKCPEQIKKSPEGKAAYEKGLANYPYQYPYLFNRMPKEMQENPKYIQKNFEGWKNYLVNFPPTNKPINVDSKDDRLQIVTIFLTVPADVKETEEYNKFSETYVVPMFVSMISENVNYYVRVPSSLKQHPSIQAAVKEVCTESLKRMERGESVGDVIDGIKKSKSVPKYSDIVQEIRDLPSVQLMERKVFVPRWLIILKNKDAKKVLDIYEKIPQNIKMLPEFIQASKDNVIPSYAKVFTENPKLNMTRYIPHVTEPVRNDPAFIAVAKQALLKYIREMPVHEEIQHQLILPELRNDPEIIGAIRDRTARARQASRNGWYKLSKVAYGRP